ncbi:hypothetical protein H2203_003297 [Taxawa tesnikishii (nom. ined.)]|nr:hypothetical protein H2203_003297 [Dothideales sp. JES 119]
MEAWVNRSAEVRQKEAAERKGYITRPMNSFMLYRSAYAERTKEFCLQNNHQVVSSVAGESWPMEPQSVRDFYNDLAKTERTNHQKAHPTYKFSPSKSTAASRKRNHEDDDDAVSDDDPDGDYAPSRRAAKQPRRQEMEQTYYVQNPYAEQPYYTQGQGVHQQAGWDAYGKPPPTPYGVDQHGQYYAHQHYQQSPVQQRQQLLAQQQAYYQQQLEQQHLRMNQAQAAPFAGQSLVSLPGSQHHELHARTQTPNQFQQQYYQAQDEFQYPEGFDPSYGLQAARTSHFDTAFLGIGANDSAWALDPALGTGLETETEYGKYLENE